MVRIVFLWFSTLDAPVERLRSFHVGIERSKRFFDATNGHSHRKLPFLGGGVHAFVGLVLFVRGRSVRSVHPPSTRLLFHPRSATHGFSFDHHGGDLALPRDAPRCARMRRRRCVSRLRSSRRTKPSHEDVHHNSKSNPKPLPLPQTHTNPGVTQGR